MLSRRSMLLAPLGTLAAPAVRAGAAAAKMTLAIHQNTSAAAGYRKSLEGWARAGIRQVEITAQLLDDFLKTDSLAAAGRVLTDNGLVPVSCACGVQNLWEPTPNHAAAIENLKKRCDTLATPGLKRLYAPVTATAKFTRDDCPIGVENMRRVGEVARQFEMTAMAEFTRTSTFVATLSTMLRMTRDAAHSNVRVLFDCYHFWSGLSKFEDLETVRPGEIGHVHFQDVPDMPRELLDLTTRVIPGDGVTPLVKILRKLGDTGYAGPLSVELFLPKFQQADPYDVAREIRTKAEAVMRQARVM
ncbi:MAG TPA: sugar phosphate isomerase/epimerase [Vicinamibacterales bacterium]|nr:sugar phosphate isomerase/epimerase [Vicinamibacterales bacterium]